MDSTDCFLEILSAYQSSDSGCQVSLLEYCHRFGVDYYKFLGWYRHYKCQLGNSTSPSDVQLTPIHVNGSPSVIHVVHYLPNLSNRTTLRLFRFV